MNRSAALMWKEWHEARWFLVVGLGIFLGLPLIAAFQARYGGYQHNDPPIMLIVLVFGGVMAVTVGVATACRDFAGRLEDFWRSRPVGAGQWLAIKFLTGLGVILLCCEAPLFLGVALDSSNDSTTLGMLSWSPFLLAALYGVAFLVGCLLRRTAPAAMLALALMLLIYFLPFVFPAMHRISVAWVMDAGPDPLHEHRVGWGQALIAQALFLATMACLCVAAMLLSIVAVRHEWQLQAGQKLMYWSLGSALLILVASAGFQVGNNLPILQTVALPERQYLTGILSDGHVGLLFSNEYSIVAEQYQVRSGVRRFTLTSSGIQIGAEIRSPDIWDFRNSNRSVYSWSPQHPDVFYLLKSTFPPRPPAPLLPDGAPVPPEERRDDLLTVVMDPTLSDPVVDRTELWNGKAEWELDPPLICQAGDRLYVTGREDATLDISDPRHPRLMSRKPSYLLTRQHDSRMSFTLPPLPGVPPRERLRAAMSRWSWYPFDGDVVIDDTNGQMDIYELKELTDTHAQFVKAGRYQWTLLENLFGYRGYPIAVGNRFGYALKQDYSMRLTVIDLSDPQRPKAAGHFAIARDAFPGGLVACPLPNGQVLVGSNKLYLLGPPPRHD